MVRGTWNSNGYNKYSYIYNWLFKGIVPDFWGHFLPIFGQSEEEFVAATIISFFYERIPNQS